MLYPLLRNSLFMLPPETAHHLSMGGLQLAHSLTFVKNQLAKQFQYNASD